MTDRDPRTLEVADVAAALIFHRRVDEDPAELLRNNMIVAYDQRAGGDPQPGGAQRAAPAQPAPSTLPSPGVNPPWAST